MSESSTEGACVLFISFEGGEGTGKSTQAQMLVQRLEEEGFGVSFVREPGSTELGWYLREWLKSGRPHTLRAELYLFIAARAELVEAEILPALQRGSIVIADRYVDSTLAYQGYGRGLNLRHIVSINRYATHETMPSLTFLLDAPPEKALQRLSAVQLSFAFPDLSEGHGERAIEGYRFEDQNLQFHQRVRNGFQELAHEDLKRWTVLDATASQNELAERVWTETKSRLERRSSELVPEPTLFQSA